MWARPEAHRYALNDNAPKLPLREKVKYEDLVYNP